MVLLLTEHLDPPCLKQGFFNNNEFDLKVNLYQECDKTKIEITVRNDLTGNPLSLTKKNVHTLYKTHMFLTLLDPS